MKQFVEVSSETIEFESGRSIDFAAQKQTGLWYGRAAEVRWM